MSTVNTRNQSTAPSTRASSIAAGRPSLRLRASSALASGNLRQTACALADQGIVSAASFVATVLVGRSGDSRQLGAFALGSSIALLAVSIQDALVASPFTVFATRLSGKPRRQYAGSLLAHQALLALCVLVTLGVTAAAWALLRGWTAMTPVLAVLAVATPPVMLREFARRYNFADLRIAGALRLDAAVALLQVAGLSALYATGWLDAALAHVAIGLACGLGAIVWLASQASAFEPISSNIAPEMARSWRFGKWLLAGQLVGFSPAYIVQWLLAIVLDTAATGALAAAMTLVLLSNPLVIGIGNLLAPRIARGYAQGGAAQLARTVDRFTLVLFAFMSAFCAGLWLLGPMLLDIFYQGRYSDQATTVNVLGLGVLAGAVGYAYDHGLRALERTEATLRANLVGLCTTIGATALLTPVAGLQGAAGGFLLGNLASSGARLWAYRVALRQAKRAEAAP